MCLSHCYFRENPCPLSKNGACRDTEIFKFPFAIDSLLQLQISCSQRMSATYPILPSRPQIPHIPTSCSKCNSHLEFPVPQPLPRAGTMLHVRCFSCQTVISHMFYPNQVPEGSTNTNISGSGTRSSQSQSQSTAHARKGRKIGTQERPLETVYYDILAIPVTAT